MGLAGVVIMRTSTARLDVRYAPTLVLVLTTLVLSPLASSIYIGLGAEPRIGLGVTGQNPMEFVAERGTRKFIGHITVINEGTVTSDYAVKPEGQVVDLEGWSVKVDPQTFRLASDLTQQIEVTIECPETEGTYIGGLRVSARAVNATGAGIGVLETIVGITIRLTPEGIITRHVARGTITEITKPGLFTSTKPATIDARNTTGAVLIISALSVPCIISISNVTPPSNIIPQPGIFALLGNIVEISSNMSIEIDATLRLYYDPRRVAEKRLDESSLKIFSWDGERWTPIGSSQVNTTGHYVSARITHLSYFASMIQLPSPFYTQWWFYLGLIATVAVGVGAWFSRRRVRVGTRH